MTDYIKAFREPRDPYHREAIDLNRGFRAGWLTIDDHGVARWKSNSRVPPADILDLAAHVGIPLDLIACDRARHAEQAAAIAAYRQTQAARSPAEVAEQRAEARAAHGPGVTLVNLFTGERFKT